MNKRAIVGEEGLLGLILHYSTAVLLFCNKQKVLFLLIC